MANFLTVVGVIALFYLAWRYRRGGPRSPVETRPNRATRYMNQLLGEIDDHVRSGHREFSIVVRQSDLGVTTRLDVFTDLVIKRIQADRRLDLVEVADQGWSGFQTLRLAVR
jgi:hypothetical protein